ncbi:winged helix-turn-helix transcriptional regulator [Myroides sp. 1354]|uniref:ArsR/SmtB family transcription factor n=1 Tax=unclassified Myroides TaxID=2642485 RepID=UPI002576711A|nr:MULTISPECIES: metalloregulator ArsR/SmtB family transcription factor [unclassified Myroides]MDM1044916.1 winged helix-turn-helix transcriptional regulator [Myroides sp. R163-1]MDM1055629.1 winged helix-turn-helix transcriptional regulator [Myroides sp. 1354]MDM1068926.1 winged helix-turn-helix transcriptional regulator [Myroides sp. 1372]
MKLNSTCIREQADDMQIERSQQLMAQLAPTVDYLSTSLSLIGNPVRLQILYLLHLEHKLCVCDLSDILGMTLSAVSQHLRKLKDRDFVSTERQGQTIYYLLTAAHLPLLTSIFHFFIPIVDEKNN